MALRGDSDDERVLPIPVAAIRREAAGTHSYLSYLSALRFTQWTIAAPRRTSAKKISPPTRDSFRTASHIAMTAPKIPTITAFGSTDLLRSAIMISSHQCRLPGVHPFHFLGYIHSLISLGDHRAPSVDLSPAGVLPTDGEKIDKLSVDTLVNIEEKIGGFTSESSRTSRHQKHLTTRSRLSRS